MSKRSLLWSLVLLVAMAAPASAQMAEKDDGKYFFFKDGDTIVVMGDSITEQLLYSNYLEMWSVARFPNRKLTFRNVGIGGDRSTGGNSRFKRDVLAHNTTVLTVDFGMNDGNYQWVGQKVGDKKSPREITAADIQKSLDVYMKGLQGIADQAKAAKIRVAWITPQPIEKRDEAPVSLGYNETLERYSDGVGQIAFKNGGVFVDQFHPYLAVLARARSVDPKNFNITGGDAVHPAAPGQVVMAASILQRLDFQKLIARISIDLDPTLPPKVPAKAPKKGKTDAPKEKTEPAQAKTGPVLEGENCKANLTSTSDGVTFTCLPSGLPFFPKEAESILKWSPILEDMNRYIVQVKGLKPGTYAIQLDGVKIAEHTAADLAQGVNLARPMLATGAVADQVQKVWTAVKDKNKYFHDQIFRGVVLANAKSKIFEGVDPNNIDAKRQEVYAERMKKMPELDAAVRQALVMKSHTVRIVSLGK